MKKKVLIFTGSRADYGLLKPLIYRFKKNSSTELILAAGGQHFSKLFGNTHKEILKDNFKIDYSCKIKTDNIKDNEVVSYVGRSLINFTKFLKKETPDIVVLLGDRYEAYSFCLASFFLNIPIAHIHGGELTLGAFDDGLRHSMTKFSNYHFSCHKNYAKRLVQLGENVKNVFNYGALGVENALRTQLINKKKLFDKFNVPLNKKTILVTFHPETKKNGNIKNEINIFLSGLKKFKDIFFIFTYNNSDPNGKYYVKKIIKNKNNNNLTIISSLGSKNYLSFLKNVDCIVGNSSSGIIEAPALKTPTINIGNRQNGREFSRSIFTCKNDKAHIEKNIKKLVFKKKKIVYDNLFFKNNTSLNIFKKINSILKKNNKKNFKLFYDFKD